MIFLDMDGTLLDSNSQISEKSKQILKKIKNDGKIIVIVTGRILKSAMKLLSPDFVDYILASNGSLWYSYRLNQIIHEKILDNKILIDFFNHYYGYFDKINVAMDHWEHFYTEQDVVKFINFDPKIYQICIELKNCDIIQFAKECEKNYSEFEFQVMQDSFSNQKSLDILKTNKGKSIVEFSKYLNCRLDSVICFGDGLNDISMFEVCGIPVAMKNSLPKLKEKAKYITDANNDNGIYKFLNHYFYEEDSMIIDLIKLKSKIVEEINIDEIVKFDSERLKKAGILELKDTRITGTITEKDGYYLNTRVYGSMVLPCSITLKPTDYAFDFEINGNIQEMLEEIGENDKNLENSIDILPIIWENILMEIPMRIVNEDVHNAKLEGEGWRVVTEEEPSVNPELQKLKDLLK